MKLTIESTNVEAIESKLYELLNIHQSESTSRDNYEKDFAYSVKIDDKTIGGITARLWHTEMHISLLALDEAYRGLGLAKELLQRIEADAVANKATIITVTTQDFQAPHLYKKMGYNNFATLPDCPFKGTTRFYFAKSI